MTSEERELITEIRLSLGRRGYPVDHLTDRELRERILAWWAVAEARGTDPAAFVRAVSRDTGPGTTKTPDVPAEGLESMEAPVESPARTWV